MTTQRSSAACVADALGGALANSDDLLRRLSEWDAMNVAPYAGDRDYWLGEIDNARTLNRLALQRAKGGRMKSDAAASTEHADPTRRERIRWALHRWWFGTRCRAEAEWRDYENFLWELT